MNPEDIQAPPLVSTPTDQHAQLMWVLGKMQGQMEALAQAKQIQNGRVDKLEGRMSSAEKWQSTNDGASITWGKIATFLTILIAAIALIVKLIR